MPEQLNAFDMAQKQFDPDLAGQFVGLLKRKTVDGSPGHGE